VRTNEGVLSGTMATGGRRGKKKGATSDVTSGAKVLGTMVVIAGPCCMVEKRAVCQVRQGDTTFVCRHGGAWEPSACEPQDGEMTMCTNQGAPKGERGGVPIA